jgi:hypothetical protein
MTDTTPAPSPAADSAGAPASDQEAVRRQALSELRRQYPRWVVQWLASTRLYHGYPLYTQRPVSVSAEQPAGLSALMDQAEQAARQPRARP